MLMTNAPRTGLDPVTELSWRCPYQLRRLALADVDGRVNLYAGNRSSVIENR